MRDDETYMLLRAHVKRSYQLFVGTMTALQSLVNAYAPSKDILKETIIK